MLPVERVVARTEAVAVYLNCFWVYPAGFEFEVFAVAKDEGSELDPFSFDHTYAAERSGEIPPEKLRLGFEFADGSKVTNTGGRFDWDWEDTDRPSHPIMSGSRGQGGEGSWSWAFWVWPLPPAGELTFVCEWPAAEIPLTRLELDAAPLTEAASRAQKLFATD
ncbi:MAG TPA: hypothetical protein VFT79_13010 [Solirubrobacterales bacterium]|nr:hypothetical protein [Solirubrobacterales bacterium]